MSHTVDYRYLVAAERLWKILDNIDTLSDVVKPTTLKGFEFFYKGVMNRVEERFKVLTSDGYMLRLPEESAAEERGVAALQSGEAPSHYQQTKLAKCKDGHSLRFIARVHECELCGTIEATRPDLIVSRAPLQE